MRDIPSQVAGKLVGCDEAAIVAALANTATDYGYETEVLPKNELILNWDDSEEPDALPSYILKPRCVKGEGRLELYVEWWAYGSMTDRTIHHFALKPPRVLASEILGMLHDIW